ncbi:MAG TPA: C40 family peptidase [Actinomycetota bacterium]|nr:C40 family peptidase [Actinomycetota bacterium]
MPLPRSPRPAAAALLAGLLAAALLAAAPAGAAPRPVPGDGAIDRARAEAARVQRSIDRLDVEVELLAEAYDANAERLDAVIRASLVHQRELADGEQALEAARAGFDDQVRSLYIEGPAASLELLLVAQDGHELAVARRAVDHSLDARRQAVAGVRAAADRLGARVAELQAAQAEVIGIRGRLADQRAGIERRLGLQRRLLADAERHVRLLVAEARAREEAARRAALATAAARARVLGLEGFATAPPPTAAAATAVGAALSQVGKPYRWGGTGPDDFDCSGLVGWAWARAGTALPRTSRQQWSAGPHVDPAHLLPGDLVFFGSVPGDPASIHHVGMYVGQGLMVDAPHTGAQVRVESIRAGGYVGATRPGAGRPAPAAR